MDESKPQPDQAIVELVKRVEGGDTDAYNELFDAFYGPVLGYVYHMLHDRQAAEGVAQDAFIRAHDRIGQLGPPYDFKSWVFQFASNLGIDYIRAGKRFVDVEDGVMSNLDDKPSTRRPYQKCLQRDAVWRSLGQLPEHYRQALFLREVNELSYELVRELVPCNAGEVRHAGSEAPTEADCQGLALSSSKTGLQSGRYCCYLTGEAVWAGCMSTAPRLQA